MEPAEAETAIRLALAEEGFGILTEIDITSIFANKLDVEYRPYRILGACNPVLAHAALEVDQRMGLLLPCNIVISTDDNGQTEVVAMDPNVMERVADNDAIGEIADKARVGIERALNSIG